MDSKWIDGFHIRDIKSTYDIKVGDTLVYLGEKLRIKKGSQWKMENKGNITAASIAIIEDGEMWRPLVEETLPTPPNK